MCSTYTWNLNISKNRLNIRIKLPRKCVDCIFKHITTFISIAVAISIPVIFFACSLTKENSSIIKPYIARCTGRCPMMNDLKF